MKRTLLSLGLFLMACSAFAQLPPPLVNAVAYWDSTATNPNDKMRGDSLAFFFHGNGIVDSILTYQVDSNGNYSLNQQTFFFNDNAGLLDSVLMIFGGGVYKMKDIYQHDSGGHITSIQSYVWFSSNWFPDGQMNYYYSSGRLDSAISIGLSGGTPQVQDRSVFFYDVSGKLIVTRSDNWDSSEWTPTDSFSITYNSNGFLDSIIGYENDSGSWVPNFLMKAKAYETNVNELWINHPTFHYLFYVNGQFFLLSPDPVFALYSKVMDGMREYEQYSFSSPSTRVFDYATTISRVGPYEEMVKDSAASNDVSTTYFRFYSPPTSLNKPSPEAFHGTMRQTASTIEITDTKPMVGVAIANPQGQVVWGRMTSGASTHQTVNIQHLPRGAYFLTLMYRDGRHATLSFVR